MFTLQYVFSVFEVSGRLPETQYSSGEYQSAMRASNRTASVLLVLVEVVVLVIVVVVVASRDSARSCSGS